jgi:uncharacterized oxidoreductase
MNTTGNTILITGGTSGLGLGFAQRFHNAGNRVIVAGRRTALLEQIARENPGIEGLELDVTDPGSIAAAAETVSERYPDLNVLVTMAGIMEPENLRDPSFLDVAERTITTNLLGPIRTIAAFTPLLTGKESATIVTVSSGLAFVPLPATPTYNATKAAIHSFSESLRIQLAATGIQVIELVPPAVRTALMGQQDSEHAMPLDAFLDESMALFASGPGAPEILVKGVEFLRFAEARGTYPEVLKMLGG